MSKSSFSAFLDATRRGGRWFQYTTSRSDTTPLQVKAVSDLYDHLLALTELFESDEPTLRLIRVQSYTKWYVSLEMRLAKVLVPLTSSQLLEQSISGMKFGELKAKILVQISASSKT